MTSSAIIGNYKSAERAKQPSIVIFYQSVQSGPKIFKWCCCPIVKSNLNIILSSQKVDNFGAMSGAEAGQLALSRGGRTSASNVSKALVAL